MLSCCGQRPNHWQRHHLCAAPLKSPSPCPHPPACCALLQKKRSCLETHRWSRSASGRGPSCCCSGTPRSHNSSCPTPPHTETFCPSAQGATHPQPPQVGYPPPGARLFPYLQIEHGHRCVPVSSTSGKTPDGSPRRSHRLGRQYHVLAEMLHLLGLVRQRRRQTPSSVVYGAGFKEPCTVYLRGNLAVLPLQEGCACYLKS